MSATDKQVAFILSLMAERVLEEESRQKAAEMLEDGLTAEQASRWIERLLELPRKAQGEAGNVPAGRYAIPGADGQMRFYKVDRPEEGKWAGWVFVKVQAGDDLWPVRDKAERARILSEIGKDARAASVAYGQEIGACGICGRTLTDAESRANGIGPVCAENVGW